MKSSNQHYNDELTRLLKKAGRGDTKAFERLHAALLPAVRDYIASLDGVMDHHQRQDLIQEVLVRTWGSRSRFRGESSAKTFVLAIAKRVLQEEWSRTAKLPSVFSSDFDQITGTHEPNRSTVVTDIEYKELSAAIEQAKARLPAAQRQAIELKHLHNLPIKEIAKLSGCGYGQFRDRLCRARKRLKQLLKDLPLSILL